MTEETIVKIMLNRVVKGQSKFTNYTTALNYAKRKAEEGYTCLILRLVNGKEWVKLYMDPPEYL